MCNQKRIGPISRKKYGIGINIVFSISNNYCKSWAKQTRPSLSCSGCPAGLTWGERAILIMVMMGGRSRRVSFKQRSNRLRSFSWGRQRDRIRAKKVILRSSKTFLIFTLKDLKHVVYFQTMFYIVIMTSKCCRLQLSAHYLIKVERRQVVPAHGLLLGVAALLQSFVSGHEETHPCAGGGRRVLTREEETN